MANTTASVQAEKPRAVTSTSANPMAKPPTTAPGMEPMPPSTAATKALRPRSEPMVGLATE